MEVHLINFTPRPAATIAARVRNYRGQMVRSLDEISDREAVKYTNDVFNTHLQGPLEAVLLNFNVFDIPRWMTHQMVRTRVGASYSQTSLRFTLVDDGQAWYHHPFDEEHPLSAAAYELAMRRNMRCYHQLIQGGASIQDARGVLPMDTLTFIGLDINYRALVGIAASRLCTQAQPLWKQLVTMMKIEVLDKMGELFADYLVPVCVHDQHCPFGSVFDRPCPMQKKYPMREADYWLK